MSEFLRWAALMVTDDMGRYTNRYRLVGPARGGEAGEPGKPHGMPDKVILRLRHESDWRPLVTLTFSNGRFLADVFGITVEDAQ